MEMVLKMFAPIAVYNGGPIVPLLAHIFNIGWCFSVLTIFSYAIHYGWNLVK
jgi:hypothetical protein